MEWSQIGNPSKCDYVSGTADTGMRWVKDSKVYALGERHLQEVLVKMPKLQHKHKNSSKLFKPDSQPGN